MSFKANPDRSMRKASRVGVCMHTHIGMQTPFLHSGAWIWIWEWPKWITIPTLFVIMNDCASEFHTALKALGLSFDFICGDSIGLKKQNKTKKKQTKNPNTSTRHCLSGCSPNTILPWKLPAGGYKLSPVLIHPHFSLLIDLSHRPWWVTMGRGRSLSHHDHMLLLPAVMEWILRWNVEIITVGKKYSKTALKT